MFMRLLPVVVSGLLLCVSASAQQAKPLRRAPGFSLPDVSQKQHDLQDYRGRWVLLDFMRTECPHCQKLSPVLEAAAKRYGAKVQVLSVVVPPDTPQKASAYAKEYGVTTPFLFDCGQVTFSYLLPSPRNPAVEFPHLYAINPQGFIAREFDSKAVEQGQVAPELEKLLGTARPK